MRLNNGGGPFIALFYSCFSDTDRRALVCYIINRPSVHKRWKSLADRSRISVIIRTRSRPEFVGLAATASQTDILFAIYSSYRLLLKTRVLTQLRPYVGHAGVPEGHVEVVFVGREYDRFVEVGLRRRRRVVLGRGQEWATVVRVRQHQRLDPGKVFGRRELPQVRVVERFQV